jgi:hypothetical protein
MRKVHRTCRIGLVELGPVQFGNVPHMFAGGDGRRVVDMGPSVLAEQGAGGVWTASKRPHGQDTGYDETADVHTQLMMYSVCCIRYSMFDCLYR